MIEYLIVGVLAYLLMVDRTKMHKILALKLDSIYHRRMATLLVFLIVVVWWPIFVWHRIREERSNTSR